MITLEDYLIIQGMKRPGITLEVSYDSDGGIIMVNTPDGLAWFQHDGNGRMVMMSRAI